MRWTLILLTLALSGCGYGAAQVRLVEQARKGLGLIEQAQAGRTAMNEQLTAMQRQRLDEAFDADVREQPALSAQWVIEHRQAYAAGLAALTHQAESNRSAEAANQANLKAVDAALARLQTLIETQENWLQQIETQWGGPNHAN